MTLNGTFLFAGPRALVWDLLQDPVVLAKALPGTKMLTQPAPDRFDGVMKVSVGPVTAAEFAIAVRITDKVAPASFAMGIDGKGAVGFCRGTASVTLADEADGATLMTYASDVQVGGRIAAVGQRLMESVGKMMMRQALEAVNKELQARLQTGS